MMIGVMKIVQQVIEYVIEYFLQEKLLVSPLSVSIGVVQSLITFGADDFLDFLNGFFIEIGIMMFERPYLSGIVDNLTAYLELKVPLVYKSILKWFRNQDELADEKKETTKTDENNQNVENQVAAQEGGKVVEENDSARKKALMFEEDSGESSRSVIYYSEDSSFNSKQDDHDMDDNVNIYLQNQHELNQSDIASVDLSKEIQELEDRIKRDKIKLQKQKEKEEKEEEEDLGTKGKGEDEDDEFEDFNDFAERRNESGNESEIKLDQDVEAQEVEPLLDNYVGYANDTLSLLYVPFFTVQLWMFYYETRVAELYEIRIQDFIYYFLFTIVIIPFQITIDILFLNLMEWYHELPMHDYLDYLAFRFKTRKSLWKSNETQVNIYIESAMQSLDQMCFSSQYFFVVAIYLSGIMQIILGIQTLLFNTEFNVFADFGTLPLAGFIIVLCVVVHRLCLWMGQLFRIWHIDETLEKLKKDDDNISVAQLFGRILDPDQHRKLQGWKDLPDEVRFDSKKWRLVDRIKIEDDQNKNDLQTDRIIAQTFRDLFMKYNKPWVQEQMYELFTPRTLFEKREDIIAQFKKVFGEIGANISMDSEKSADSAKDNTDSLFLDSKAFEKKIYKKTKKFQPTQEEIDWVHQNDVPYTRAIIRYWILRSRLKQKIRIEVNSLIQQQIQKSCLYCKATYGLNVELMQNIEDMFYSFLKIKKASIVDYDILAWQRYFTREANTRTICLDCSNAIETWHRNVRNELRDQEERRLQRELGLEVRKRRGKVGESEDDDIDSGAEEDSLGLEKRRIKARQMSEQAKLVIRLWVYKARERMSRKRHKKQQQILRQSEKEQ